MKFKIVMSLLLLGVAQAEAVKSARPAPQKEGAPLWVEPNNGEPIMIDKQTMALATTGFKGTQEKPFHMDFAQEDIEAFMAVAAAHAHKQKLVATLARYNPEVLYAALKIAQLLHVAAVEDALYAHMISINARDEDTVAKLMEEIIAFKKKPMASNRKYLPRRLDDVKNDPVFSHLFSAKKRSLLDRLSTIKKPQFSAHEALQKLSISQLMLALILQTWLETDEGTSFVKHNKDLVIAAFDGYRVIPGLREYFMDGFDLTPRTDWSEFAAPVVRDEDIVVPAGLPKRAAAAAQAPQQLTPAELRARAAEQRLPGKPVKKPKLVTAEASGSSAETPATKPAVSKTARARQEAKRKKEVQNALAERAQALQAQRALQAKQAAQQQAVPPVYLGRTVSDRADSKRTAQQLEVAERTGA